MKRTRLVAKISMVVLILIYPPLPYLMAAEAPSQSTKALPNGGQLIIKSTTDEEFPFGHQWFHYDYSYITPNDRIIEKIGKTSCKNSETDANPEVIFAGKLILLTSKCETPALYVRTSNKGWCQYLFDEQRYEKFPLWQKYKVPLDSKWGGYSEIVSIDPKTFKVIVEHHTYKISKLTFKLAPDGNSIQLTKVEKRTDPNHDPPKLISQLTDKTQIPSVRAAAANSLGGMEEHGAVEALMTALSDDNLNVRRLAIEALGKIGDRRAAPPLMVILENKKEDKHTKSAAAKALGNIKANGAVQLLISSLNDTAPEVRCASAGALGEIGDGRAIGPLVRISQQRFREKWSVRRCAVEALGNFGDRSVQALNETISAFFENREVKAAAKASLERIQRKVKP